MPSDLDGLKRDLGILRYNLQQLLDLSRELIQFVGVDGDTDGFGLALVRVLENVAMQLPRAPDFDRLAFNDPNWSACRGEIRTNVSLGKELQLNRSELSSLVVEDAWSEDVSDLRFEMARLSWDWLRWFRGRWWAIQKEAKQLVLPSGSIRTARGGSLSASSAMAPPIIRRNGRATATGFDRKSWVATV